MGNAGANAACLEMRTHACYIHGNVRMIYELVLGTISRSCVHRVVFGATCLFRCKAMNLWSGQRDEVVSYVLDESD